MVTGVPAHRGGGDGFARGRLRFDWLGAPEGCIGVHVEAVQPDQRSLMVDVERVLAFEEAPKDRDLLAGQTAGDFPELAAVLDDVVRADDARLGQREALPEPVLRFDGTQGRGALPIKALVRRLSGEGLMGTLVVDLEEVVAQPQLQRTDVGVDVRSGEGPERACLQGVSVFLCKATHSGNAVSARRGCATCQWTVKGRSSSRPLQARREHVPWSQTHQTGLATSTSGLEPGADSGAGPLQAATTGDPRAREWLGAGRRSSQDLGRLPHVEERFRRDRSGGRGASWAPEVSRDRGLDARRWAPPASARHRVAQRTGSGSRAAVREPKRDGDRELGLGPRPRTRRRHAGISTDACSATGSSGLPGSRPTPSVLAWALGS